MTSFGSRSLSKLIPSSVSLSMIALIAPGTVPAQISFQDSPKAVLDQAWRIVDQTYVDPQFNHVNWQQTRQTLLSRTYSDRASAYAALKTALKQLNDPYTRFLDPQAFQALNSQDINGELSGVGLQLQNNTQSLQVVKAIEDSPALKAGLQSDDKILAIDGRSTKGMTVEAASQLIRGRENTTVTLLIARANLAPFKVTITRQKLTLPVVYSALRQQGNQRVGYIRLAEFSGHAADQMKKAIESLSSQKVDRFVLDLRGNPGGRLDQETEIARMWLNQGTIVRIVDRDKNAESIQANQTALTNLPLTVLVDGGSASASEILTGALKDNHRAIIIGTQTFGKALVQSVNPLSDGSGINVTIARYFTPSGLDINHKGITPNIVLELSDQQRKEFSTHPDELGTQKDPQYLRALEVKS